MLRPFPQLVACVVAACLAPCSFTSQARAHGIVGSRFFPATLVVDDPFVADELSLPTASYLKNGDQDQQTDFSIEFAKRLTDVIGVSVAPSWTHLQFHDGGHAIGVQNLETTLKYQFITLPEQEFLASVGLSVEWGGTGSAAVGAESYNVFTPMGFFGKGFGDLPDGLKWLRPFAVTGQIGYSLPETGDVYRGEDYTEHHPEYLVYGGTVQYSMPYLKASVMDLGLPYFLNHLIPIVEASFVSPTANNRAGEKTTGVICPGFLLIGGSFQVGAEAQFPINVQSGHNVGVVGQFHFYLDDLFPTTVGAPLFGPTSARLSSENAEMFGGR
jgi:hypothetical protein